MRFRPALRRFHAFTASEPKPSSNRGVIQELQHAIEQWAFSSRLRRGAGSWQQQIARDKLEHLKHLNALRVAVKEGRHEGISERWLTELDRLEMDLSIARRWALLHKRIPMHRPSEARFRAECQQVMKRHRIGPDSLATTIVKVIAPTLPKWVQIALIGDWKEERQRIKLLADRIRKPA
jgi:hypothetical protein